MTSLADISDVDTTATADQVLTFNGASFVFTDKTVDTDDQIASEVGFTPSLFIYLQTYKILSQRLKQV